MQIYESAHLCVQRPQLFAMDQDTLRRAWLYAPGNRLCAWEVAKALGLREASKEIHNGTVSLPWVAARVTKVGGGRPNTSALHQLFGKINL